jgi:hypothetical protein
MYSEKCKILGFHAGDCDDCVFWSVVPCVWVLPEPTFRKNVLPVFAGWKEPANYELLLTFLARWFYLEDDVTRSSETMVLTRLALHHTPEDGILHTL